MAPRFVERNPGPVPETGIAARGYPCSKFPGHELLHCTAFATQMPLARKKYSVSRSKNALKLEPPYGIEP
jgi:hypothetical protein